VSVAAADCARGIGVVGVVGDGLKIKATSALRAGRVEPPARSISTGYA
jgi:hypothetical protein